MWTKTPHKKCEEIKMRVLEVIGFTAAVLVGSCHAGGVRTTTTTTRSNRIERRQTASTTSRTSTTATATTSRRRVKTADQNNDNKDDNDEKRALQSRCLDRWLLTTLQDEGCSYDALVQELDQLLLQNNCNHGAREELRMALGAGTDQQAQDEVWWACRQAYADAENDDFVSISLLTDGTPHNQAWHKDYFDGHTVWNELPLEPLDIYGNERNDTVELPLQQAVPEGIVMPAIENFDECALRAVNCCWIQDRQANDNNGDCTNDWCEDANPMDNTDVCYTDLSRSSSSNHVQNGFVLYEGEAEDDTHCHGFAWSDDFNDPSYVFRGSTLYYVSLLDHWQTRGYIKNLPGAPLCGCLEQMPTMTRTDCTDVTVKAMTVQYDFDVSAEPLLEVWIDGTNVELEHTDCVGMEDGITNDLDSFYQTLVRDGHATPDEYAILKDQYLVDDCVVATERFLERQWLRPRQPVTLPNDASGRLIYALEGQHYTSGVGAATTAVGYDTEWGFKSVSCPVDNKNNKGNRCYLVVNYASGRRLFAEKGKTDTDGVGATSGGIRNDQKWTLTKTKCPSDNSPACYNLVNAFSDRTLYADIGMEGPNGFGAAFGDDTVVQRRESTAWRIENIDVLHYKDKTQQQ